MNHTTPIAFFTLLLAAPVWAARSVEETRPAEPDVKVSIENLSGSVEVTGWDRSEVKVSGSLGDDTRGLWLDGDPSDWEIEVEIPDGRWGGRRDLESRLEVWVPRGAEVEVETVSASIRIRDVDGRLDLESVSGEIDAAGGGRRVELETVSGAIDFTGGGATWELDAESVSGRVTLRGVRGEIEASSVSGRLDVEAVEIRRGVFESVSGDVRLDLDPSGNAVIDVEAHSSNVTLTLPANVSARFQVSTFSGKIDNDFGPTGERTSRFAPGRSLDHTTGDGAVRVSIETFSGNVSLRRR